jgi:transposase
MRSSSVRTGLAQRARIVLLAADGVSNTAIAQKLRVSRPTVIRWRQRYERGGLAGLVDEPRSGRPRVVDHRDVVAVTLASPPSKLGVTHWSSRLLLAQLGISNGTVAKAWREYGAQPWWAETFKFSTDPQLVAKVTDVVGLYLAQPENAVVLCVGEKFQIQALDRTAPMVAVQPGLPARRTHDSLRHGTTTLFAALEIATGKVCKVTAACKAPPPPPGVPDLSQAGPRLPPGAAAPGDGQLPRPQTNRDQDLAGRQPPRPGPLHPHVGLVAQSR